MNVIKEYSKIINSEEFKEFKKENSDAILANVFLDKNGWQFNYLCNNKMISFYLEDELIKTEESEVYEKQKDLEELKIEELKIDLEKAEEIIKKVSDEEATKKIIILQQKEVPIWNITYITSSLNVVNLRVNAISGEVLEQKSENIMNFKGDQ